MGTAIAVLSLMHLPETFFTEPLETKVLTVFTDVPKPRLTVSEACHRLALIEGQKENGC